MPIVAPAPPKPTTPVPSPEATALAAALTRFLSTSSCPAYLRSAAQAWLPTVTA